MQIYFKVRHKTGLTNLTGDLKYKRPHSSIYNQIVCFGFK